MTVAHDSPTTHNAPARGRPVATLLGLLGHQRWWLLATALLAFGTLASSIGLIATSAYLISRSAVVSSTATLAVTITLVRLFALGRAGFRYAERYVGHLTTFRALTRIRVWFFRAIEPLAPARLTEHRDGDLLTRIVADIEALQDFYLRVAVPPVAAGLATILAAVVLGSFSPAFGVAVVAFLVAGGVVVPLVGARAARADARAAVADRAAMSATVVEGLAGMAELVAWGREDLFTGAAATHTARAEHHDRRLATVRGTAAGASAVITGLAAMTLLALAVPMVRNGDLDGVFLAVMPLTALAAFESVQPLAAAVDHFGRSRAAVDRLVELVDTRPAVVDPPDPVDLPGAGRPACPVALAFDGLTFSYGDQLPAALQDVTATIPAGSHVAMVGPSGSGKSTLVALLLRFWDYDRGSITIDGTELRTGAAAPARRVVAAVQQHDHLFDTTVRDNLLLADPDADDARIEAALHDADALEFVTVLPDGLDERVGENGNRLSGGERQRLMIARALLADTPVLVLDEATAHLDPATERRVLDRVRRRLAGRTLITISHHGDALDGVDLVLRFERGRGTAVCPPA